MNYKHLNIPFNQLLCQKFIERNLLFFYNKKHRYLLTTINMNKNVPNEMQDRFLCTVLCQKGAHKFASLLMLKSKWSLNSQWNDSFTCMQFLTATFQSFCCSFILVSHLAQRLIKTTCSTQKIMVFICSACKQHQSSEYWPCVRVMRFYKSQFFNLSVAQFFIIHITAYQWLCITFHYANQSDLVIDCVEHTLVWFLEDRLIFHRWDLLEISIYDVIMCIQ